MNIGIICEFDPLHNGHAHLLRQAKSIGGGAVVCVMSGQFTQRGSFAAVDKRARAEMALRCGADLVLELPVVWAMAGAERFARGGIAVLQATQVVDAVLFGSECGDLTALQAVADGLDSPAFGDGLKQHQKGGVSFAAARQRALNDLPHVDGSLLERPNNTLGIEYLRAIRHFHAPLTALTIPRIGAGHDGQPEGDTASASHLRQLLRQGQAEEACMFMPSAATDILRREAAAGRITDGALCNRAILAHVRKMTEADWQRYDGGHEGLYHRLYQAAKAATSVEELLALAKTKRYPLARLRRMVLAAWLELPIDVPGTPPYLRLLGANDTGRKLLRQMQDRGAPVLTKPADVSVLGGEAAALLAVESRCTDLYGLARPHLTPAGEDMRFTPVMV